MPAAPCQISVSHRRPERQTKSAAYIDQSQRRCAARMAVVCDTALSPGARLLYVLLDDYAGMKAECWPGQGTLATQIGACSRQVKRWIAELATRGHLAPRRTLTGNRYVLSWGQGTPVSHPPEISTVEVPTVGTPVSPAIEEVFEPEKEPAPSCPTCGDSGWCVPRQTTCSCEEGRAIRERLMRVRVR